MFDNQDLPSPLHDAGLIGLPGQIIKLISPQSEADPAALLINILTMFGSVIGNSPHFLIERKKNCMRLFVIIVGETGSGRKGTSLGYPQALFGAADPIWAEKIKSGLSSGEGLIETVKDKKVIQKVLNNHNDLADVREVVVDEGVEDKRALIIEEEFVSVLKQISREGNILSPIIRRAWDSGDLQTLTKNSVRATGAHISIIGQVTPTELLTNLSSSQTANGFGNRFVFIYSKKSKDLPFGGSISDEEFNKIVNLLKMTIDYAKNINEVKFSLEVEIVWPSIYYRLNKFDNGLVNELSARATPIVRRLACIYALFDMSSIVQLEHLKAALSVWDYSYASLKYIFRNKYTNIIHNEIIDLLKFTQEGLSTTEISNSFNRNKSSDQLQESLNKLVQSNVLLVEEQKTNGRTKTIYKFNSFYSYLQQESYVNYFEKVISEKSNELNELRKSNILEIAEKLWNVKAEEANDK